MLANLILLVGMAWAFGYVTLTVGHLNILSVSFTVTMIGIGIDYGIYYVARYLQLRTEKYECEPALLETSRGAGPAITTGALTTAVAFFAAGLTSFTGVAELGIIAGGGILLCAVAELTLLPAAIALMDRSGWGVRMPSPLPIHKWIMPFYQTTPADAGCHPGRDGLSVAGTDPTVVRQQPAQHAGRGVGKRRARTPLAL